MANKHWNELAKRANNGELTADDLNVVVLAFADHVAGVNSEIKELKTQSIRHTKGLRDIEEEYPLLPPEADDLSKAVQKRGVAVMGGKKTPAYANTDLRRRIYRDIYFEVKRQYGLVDDMGRQQSYKKLKRKYLNGALSVVAAYELPISLANEVEAENEVEEEN